MILTPSAGPPASYPILTDLLTDRAEHDATVESVKKGLFIAIALAAIALPASTAAGGGPLLTAVDADGDAFSGPQTSLAFQRVHEAGANVVRINVIWSKVAARKPASRRRSRRSGVRLARVRSQGAGWQSRTGSSRCSPSVVAPRWAETGLPRPDRLGGFDVGSWRPDPAAARRVRPGRRDPVRRCVSRASARPLLGGLERAQPHRLPQPAGRQRKARRPDPVPRPPERHGRGDPRRPRRQRRRRRRPGAVQPQARRRAGRDAAAAVHARSSVHVRRDASARRPARRSPPSTSSRTTRSRPAAPPIMPPTRTTSPWPTSRRCGGS